MILFKVVGGFAPEAFQKITYADPIAALTLNTPYGAKAVDQLRAMTQWTAQIITPAACLLEKMDMATKTQRIQQALVNNPEIAQALWDVFDAKFDPAQKGNVEDKTWTWRLAQAEVKIQQAKNKNDKTILKILADVLRGMVRSNFYRRDYKGDVPYLSFKLYWPFFNVLKQKDAPRFEHYVHSHIVNGVHMRALRGEGVYPRATVARGGLRWSKRDDYRLEVFGLRLAQVSKNAVITPDGAKGGFLLTDNSGNAVAAEDTGRSGYKVFVRGNLELVDNAYVDEQNLYAIRPDESEMVCYDEVPDYYFVVAADAGTGTMSNTANQVACDEFNFWLGYLQAFASGGKTGIDHKVEGITARGAWAAAAERLQLKGIFLGQGAPASVVFCGAPWGDVAGNGMLALGEKGLIKGAFDDRHVVYLPKANVWRQAGQIQRLYHAGDQNPDSGRWDKYDAGSDGIIADLWEGSGKDRKPSAKVIETTLPDGLAFKGTPMQLAAAMLKQPIDVIFFGGLGTYIIADNEAVPSGVHPDMVVRASDIKAKVVVEGGNLQVSFAARNQLNRQGTLIDADHIDNMGGVTASDFEVLMKLTFASKLGPFSEAMTIEEIGAHINSLETTAFAAHKILTTAALQTWVIMVNQHKSGVLEIATLAQEVLGISRAELQARVAQNQGYTRTEWAYLLSATITRVKQAIMDSDIPDQTENTDFLYFFFPRKFVEQFKDLIDRHPMRREIIATEMAKLFVFMLNIQDWFDQDGQMLSPQKMAEFKTKFERLRSHPKEMDSADVGVLRQAGLTFPARIQGILEYEMTQALSARLSDSTEVIDDRTVQELAGRYYKG